MVQLVNLLRLMSPDQIVAATPPPAGGALLKEDGFYILTEAGDHILLE